MAAPPDSNPIPKPSSKLQDSDEVQKVFNSFDANGDGKISVSELGSVLKALDSTTYSTAELSAVMNEIDTDRDGFISLQEFAALCRASDESDGGGSELRDAFDLYDQDKNGLISASELHQVLNRLSMGCSVGDCEKMIKSVDADGDGNVSFEEFEKMMTNNVPKRN